MQNDVNDNYKIIFKHSNMTQTLTRLQANLLLLLAALAWGCAFVPQAIASKYIGAFSFTGTRFLLGALVISPLVWREWKALVAANRTPSKRDWLQIALMGILLCMGTSLQQVGMAFTTVTNAGFLTGLYVPLVPLLGWILYRRRAHWVVWPAALGCVVGTWLLTGAGQVNLNVGDLWVLATVIPFTLHVLWVGGVAEKLQAPLLVSWGQFVVCGLVAGSFALPLENFDSAHIKDVFWPIVYMSVISVGVGFTSQVIGQRFARPAEAAIILSAETVFAALAGAIVLGERLNTLGYVGCALILLGIVVVQVVPTPVPHPLIEQH